MKLSTIRSSPTDPTSASPAAAGLSSFSLSLSSAARRSAGVTRTISRRNIDTLGGAGGLPSIAPCWLLTGNRNVIDRRQPPHPLHTQQPPPSLDDRPRMTPAAYLVQN